MNKSHNLTQGSPEWHAFRTQHFGASEASAMLGISPYKTRTQLLDEKKTGLTVEVDSATQRVFDNGHRVEALARPIVEKMIGEELSPVTYSNGKLSASSDGITYMGEVAWENKQFNAAHFEQVKNGELPEIHWPQCQQVLHCTGAEKLFFTISDGTEDRTAGIWVYPDADKVTQLLAGWDQFEKDLADHVPAVKVQKVEAAAVKTLPVPSIVVRGEVTVSNLNEITPQFDDYLASINTELSTDQDFADADAHSDKCEEVEKRIKTLRESIIAQMVDINTIDSTLANYQEAFRKMKVLLKNAVKDQKDNIKTTAIMKAKVAYADFVTELNKDIEVMLSQRLVCPDFAGAIKGVQKLDSMQSRINDALANGKAEATTFANDVKTKLAYITEAIKGYDHLINVHQLAFENLDYIKLNIQSVKDAEDRRKAEHEAAIKAKAEADAKALIDAQQADHERQLAESKELLPVINNTTINEADFNNVFEVKEHATRTEPETSYFYGTEPTANEIVSALATAFKVDELQAHAWLIKADFTKYQSAKKAA